MKLGGLWSVLMKQFWPGVLTTSVIAAMARAVACHAQNVPVHMQWRKEVFVSVDLTDSRLIETGKAVISVI